MKWIHIALVPVSLSLAACASHGRTTTATTTTTSARGATPAPSARAQSLDALGHAPLAFEAVDDGYGRYACRTPTYTLRVAPTWAELDLPRAGAKTPRVRMRLLDASPDAEVAAADPLVTRVNYVLGSDPARWRANVRTYERVRYSAVYPGIDLVYYGTAREIEHDFVVAPGGNPDRIAWAFDGASALRVQPNGDLQLTGGAAPIRFRAPKAYQLHAGTPQPIDVRYKLLNDSRVGFEIARYDATQPLIIDPVLNVAATLGGRDEDEGAAIAVDNAGNIYVAGVTESVDFPASGANAGGLDIFIVKLDSTGTHVLSSSYLGGSRTDDARAIAVDATGNVYVAGVTTSPNFPMKTPVSGTLRGDSDAFVLKLSTTGAGLIFSTYLGGTGTDEAHGIAIDAARNVYVTGDTTSADFQTASPLQGANGGQLDAFVTKLSPAGNAILYSTYLGGNDTDSGQAIGIDGSGNASVVGSTSSTNFPVQNAFQNAAQGDSDAFVARLTPAGALVFSTYFGGPGFDAARAVAVNNSGGTYVTGSTLSTAFPVIGPAVQTTSHGGMDAFIAIVLPNGQPYLSTYLGGSGSDRGHAIALDKFERVYIAGQTMSTDFPAANPAQPTIMGDRDAFLVMLPGPPYNTIGYATYLGTGDNDDSLSVAADRIGRAYLTGVKTYSWPATTGHSDAFVMRLSTGNDTLDTDHDGMPDDWETKYGLDPEVNDANGDPDGDGVSNLAEFQADTNPLGFYTRYLAEGATGTFFDDQVALFNTSGTVTANALLRFQKDDQTEVHQLIVLPPHARRTVFPKTIPGLVSANFSTVIESNTDVIADRTMTWDKTAYGAHAETAGDELSKVWYLAEGSTGGFFDLYYLLQNPGGTQANVTITYLLPFGQLPIKKNYTVAPHSRFTIHVDDDKQLNNTDLSAQIDADQPILVERAMYMTTGGKIYSAGHDAAGVTSPARTWFLAEGATGVFFDLFILIANPNATATDAQLEYLLPNGDIVTKTYHLDPQSRLTIPVDGEDPKLADTGVSTRVTAPIPIVVERAMWWPSPVWYEAHDSAGAVVTSPMWAVAEGQEGGTSEAQTFILIANTSNIGGYVDVTLYFEDDTAPLTKSFFVLPNSRFNVHINGEFEAARDQRYATVVKSASTPLELVVERATYMNSGKVTWAAGTNSLGTPIFADSTVLVTGNGAFPKHVVVPDGTRVAFVNRDTVSHAMKSTPHPFNNDCTEITTMTSGSPIAPGETRLTGNLVFQDGNSRCGFLDDAIFTNQAYWGEIVIKPPSVP